MRRIILIGLLVLGLLSLRFVHLDADTPVLITLPDDVGLYVDEGYKTLDARNLAQFGTIKWNSADNYPGWMSRSPLTQWSYYAGFQMSAPDLVSARVVTVLYFGLFLMIYIWAMHMRLHWSVLIGGLLAFGLESTLFFYSRVALFEIPLITFLYGLLFYFARIDARRLALPLVLTLVCGAFVAITIKMSAVFYVIPIMIAAVIHLLLQTKSGPQRRQIRAVVMGITVAVLVLFIAMYDWLDALFIQQNVDQSSHPFSIAGAFYRTLTMHLMRASPFVVVLGLVCLAHGLATRPDQYLGNLYRLSLICIVLLAPVIVSVLPYSPLRYYLPALPAYLLLVLEWFHLEIWRADISSRISAVRRIWIIGLLAMAMFAVLFPAYVMFSDMFPVLSASRASVVKYLLLPAAVVMGALVWTLRATIFQRRVVMLGGMSMLLAFTGYSAYGLTKFLFSPTYQVQAVRAQVARIVGAEATLAGDWAPMFALGTPVRALYMNRRYNPAETINATRPDYFVHSESPESRRSLEVLMRAPGVRIDPPIDVGTYYNGRRRVALYPLHYAESARHAAPQATP
ncbi:MAG: hypothetical protein KKE76_05660 [Gammaproteobacteria bacterium]|nr:hypothetical protein [Gammaproteobacteria bacterium]